MKNRTSITFLILLRFSLSSFAGGPIVDPYKFASATPSPTPADTTPPTLLSATVDNSGTVLTLVFSEPVTADDWVGTSFVMQDYGTTYDSGDAVDSIAYDISHGPVRSTDSELLSYDGIGNVQDMAGNSLAPFTDFPVTNNSKL